MARPVPGSPIGTMARREIQRKMAGDPQKGLLAHLLRFGGWGGCQGGLTTEPEEMVGALGCRVPSIPTQMWVTLLLGLGTMSQTWLQEHGWSSNSCVFAVPLPNRDMAHGFFLVCLGEMKGPSDQKGEDCSVLQGFRLRVGRLDETSSDGNPTNYTSYRAPTTSLEGGWSGCQGGTTPTSWALPSEDVGQEPFGDYRNKSINSILKPAVGHCGSTCLGPL